MFTDKQYIRPELEAPGNGLPKIELFFANILVRWKFVTTSPEKALDIFKEERAKILTIARNFPEELASMQVLTKRIAGLEDSSRFWSLYMTMEHLRIVNKANTEVMSSLLAGNKPDIVIDTARVKPDEGINNEIIDHFELVCDQFEEGFNLNENLKTPVTLAHPWFGELNAQQWHFFAAFHMTLHRKQMELIAEKLHSSSSK